MVTNVETCTARPCGALVTIIIARDGGIPVAVNGYNGLTDDGDAVCPDHFCPTCGNFHTTAEAFDSCEGQRWHRGATAHLCSLDAARAVLAR